ncbi:MAG: hypothetical protein A2073_07810 [Deltaproteobacteria bacterium GWC2_42_11]|nr:MAG: hypothetical protein A2073_07810 [Deltaproteobacteria bacterium GWC2_42_11]HBO84394.1 hypothetical protein [Deltaproteobacteria bacterium]
MSFTVTLTDISVFMIAISVFIFVLYLIPLIIQLRETARDVQRLAEKYEDVMVDLKSITGKVNEHMDDVGDVVKNFKDVGLKVTGLTDLLFNKVKTPIITIISLLTGIGFGIKHYRKGGEEDVR